MLDPRNTQATRESTMEKCRACGADHPYLFLSYGEHSPGQMLIRPEDIDKPQPAFPLNAQACLECGLIAVADQMVYNAPRTSEAGQRLSLQSRHGMRNPRVIEAIRIIEANLNDPLSSAEVAAAIGQHMILLG